MSSALTPALTLDATRRPARLVPALVVVLLAVALSLALAVSARTAKPIVFYGAAGSASAPHATPNKPIMFW